MRWRSANRYSTLSYMRHINYHRWNKNWWWFWLTNFFISKTKFNLRIDYTSFNLLSFQFDIKSFLFSQREPFQFIIFIIININYKINKSENVKKSNRYVIKLKDVNQREDEISILINVKQSNDDKGLFDIIDLLLRVSQRGF